MTTDERIHRINQVLEDYFKQNPYKIQAKELMPLFIKNGIGNKCSKINIWTCKKMEIIW